MILIRREQMAFLARDRGRRFAFEMCDYLRTQFCHELWGMTASELQHKVDIALTSAANYGLVSEQDCCLYLNLCIVYGWEFELQQESLWMLEMLTDVEISSASLRLHRLIGHCIYQEEVKESNRRLRRIYEAAPGEDFAAGTDMLARLLLTKD